jgi:hypothetical protein
LINFTVIGYMLGFKILKEYQNPYENVFLLLLSEFGDFGSQPCLSAVNLNILHLPNFNILSRRQQVGLKSKVCKYCKQKVTGDLDYRTYHFYINHPDKIKELIEIGWSLKYSRMYKTIDNAVIEFIHEMQPIHERESQLI